MRNSIETDAPPPCGANQRKKGFSSRFSLRRLIYSSPILGQRRQPRAATVPPRPQQAARPAQSKDSVEGKASCSSRDFITKLHRVEVHQHPQSRTSLSAPSIGEGVSSFLECPLCLLFLPLEEFVEVSQCGHKACITCLKQYLKVQITESRVSVTCPECSESIHPNEIRSIINDEHLFSKYEDFMVRRVLAVDPDTRWCPAPDCSFAVIASECASCPKLKCERPGCNSYFCYHCKAEWHPNQTCDAARAQRSPNIRSSSVTYSQDSQCRDDIKPCPRCQVLIVKMDDGSCNHMMCAVCGAEFCWLCMKEISDLHYLSPSGCTFWGKKPWSRKKKILWQLGTLVGAPVGIALIAGITIPAMIIGIPVWVGRKLYGRYKNNNKHKRNAAIVGGVLASVIISPILASMAVAIGVPILLFYVYGVVPVSLCRSGGCGPVSGILGDEDSTPEPSKGGSGGGGGGPAAPDTVSMDAVSQRVANPSIGEASLASGVYLRDMREMDRESASTVALAGSVGATSHKLEVVHADLVSAQRSSISSLSDKSVNVSIADDGAASTRALAGSMLNYKVTGSDSCSCVINGEDCTSERIHLEEITVACSSSVDKMSIGSNCSYNRAARCSGKSSSSSAAWSKAGCDKTSDTTSNDSIYLDIAIPAPPPPSASVQTEERPRRTSMAALRSQFFHSDNKPKSLEDRVIIEVSNETLDRQMSWEEPAAALGERSTSILMDTSKL